MKKILGLSFGLQTVFFLVVSQVLFTSCATTVKFPVQRPAELDSMGAQTIAVLPFSYGNKNFFYYNHSTDSEFVANYIQTKFQDRIGQSDFFTQIEPQPILKAIHNGLKPPCDLYIHGSIYNLSDKLNKVIVKTEEEENKNTKDRSKREKKKILYSRSVSLSVNYKIIYTLTGQILYSTTQHIEEETSEYEVKTQVPNFFSLIQYDLDYKIRTIVKKLVPYTTTRKISLLKDKSKNPIIEAKMESANELAKNGLTSQAQIAFMGIYQDTGSFEAGYNAARLLEAADQLDQAAQLMYQIYMETHHKKAEKALKEILKEIEYAERLQQQLKARNNNIKKTPSQSPQEKKFSRNYLKLTNKKSLPTS